MSDALLVCLVEAVAFAAAFFFVHRDRAHERIQWTEKERALLDRIMSRDYAEYRTLERIAAPRPELTAEGRREREDQEHLASEARGLV